MLYVPVMDHVKLMLTYVDVPSKTIPSPSATSYVWLP
jgi:hypothetical protein